VEKFKYELIWVICLIGFSVFYAANYVAWPAADEFDLDSTVVTAIDNAGAPLALLRSDLELKDNQMNISQYSDPLAFGKSLSNETVMCFLVFDSIGTSDWNIETSYYQVQTANTLAVYKETQYYQARNMAYAIDDTNSSIRQLKLYKSDWGGFWKGVGQLIVFAVVLIIIFLLISYLDKQFRRIWENNQ
jgi:hypothetical protein